MENLFKYAKKELSQDAFLLWMLSNACSEDETLKPLAAELISFLTGEKDLKIKDFKLNPQWEKIDIVAEVTLENNEEFYIFIEDKTTSNEHNQLEKYNEKINEIKKYREGKCFKRFYKTDWLNPAERQRVNDAKWEIIELDDIIRFWESRRSSDNLIVRMYADRIVEIYNALTTKDIPPSLPNDKQLEMFMWKGFFVNKVIPTIEDKCDAYSVKTNYSYIALCVKPKGRQEESMPYLEIRDRDCANGKFKALLLTYGMSKDNKRIKEWDDIQKHGNGTIFKKSPNNCTNQVLNTDNIKQENADDFIELVKNCINDYLVIMEKTGFLKTVSH